MGFYILSYLCMAVFIGSAGCLIYRQLKLPLHVRWEIYPVRHETAARIAYGGSYMEKINWWNQPHRSSRSNELKYMAPEILLLRGLMKENKSLWRFSFPFHFGLYLMIATFCLLLIHAVLTLWGFRAFTEGGIPLLLMDGLIAAAGWTGLILGSAGSAGMLYRRVTDRELRDYSSFADYFNIFLIGLFFFSALITSLFVDPAFQGARGYTLGLLTAGSLPKFYIPGQSIPGVLTIVLSSLLVAYIPLTHMSHMFMKYFLYHNVKWDDAPNRPGGKMEVAVKRNLDLKPTWQAKHIGADGHKSWRDISTSDPGEMK